MLARAHQRALAATGCEVRFDTLTRELHATDASIYHITPAGVAFPRNTRQAAAVIRTAAEAGVPVIPRGAGTGLVGGCIGDGLVVDLARFNRSIDRLDLETRTVRVGAGVVLDQLNAFLQPHGFRFGPDVATSSRATLGGMIANDSSGSHVPVYGTTSAHVESLEVALADGRVVVLGPAHLDLAAERRAIGKLVTGQAPLLRMRLPAGLSKRWPGYGLSRFAGHPDNLAHLVGGSEGTLAAITAATLRIVPLPDQPGTGLIFFASIAEAMQATVELLDLQPAAIEHIDRILFDQTRGQLAFKAARDLLELDARPCESILIVEFFTDVADRLAALAAKGLGLRTLLLKSAAEVGLVWGLRKAGLALLTGCPGSAKPVTGIEDTAVRPEQLPDYVAGLRSLLEAQGLSACFYGHAASGLLHVRPVLDLKRADEVAKFRQLARDVSALVRQFNGSIAAEHGVGIARTEFLPDHLGADLIGLMRQIKRVFDPRELFNPGKLFNAGRYRIDTQLRAAADLELRLPAAPRLAFAAKDGSFAANLEQCNGCGGCRKETPTMCPTFVATGDELMSTRGRANLIRAALAGRVEGDPLHSAELEAALGNCLSCKACTSECPSNVNLALLKAELLYARHQRSGMPLQARLFGAVDRLGRLGCLAPRAANAALQWRWARRLLSRWFGLALQRPLPRFTRERFDHWFERRPAQPAPPQRPQVILWDDCFARYHEPHIARAAVAVLEAAGFQANLLRGRECCGRPAFSQGCLDQAARCGRRNLRRLASAGAVTGSAHGSGPDASAAVPILFLEPSCYSMFAEDYRELNLPGAAEVAMRCRLFEDFVDELLQRDPRALLFGAVAQPIAIHAHCHAKSLLDVRFLERLARQLPDARPTLLNTGCCGMAGAFGMLEEKQQLSTRVAEPLVEKLASVPDDGVVVASGASCRHQISYLTARQPLHMAELLAAALAQASAR